jgi:GNAT superfamily N-acetyltransferase
LVDAACQERSPSDSARVYVTTPADGEPVVVGYYALAASQVEPDAAAARTLKGQPKGRPVPAILLARLAVDREHQGGGVGRSLLQDALLRCVEAAASIGARVLLVHAKHDEVKAWYMQYDSEESPTDPLHLLLMMKDIRAALAELGLS